MRKALTLQIEMHPSLNRANEFKCYIRSFKVSQKPDNFSLLDGVWASSDTPRFRALSPLLIQTNYGAVQVGLTLQLQKLDFRCFLE